MTESIAVRVGSRIFDGSAQGNAWIDRGGLDGWWDSAETDDDSERIPGTDGDFEGGTLLGARRFTFRAVVDSSSTDWAELEVRPWAAALSKSSDIEFGLFSAGSWRYLRRAQVRGQVRVIPHVDDMRRTTIEVPVWAADPRKYGRTVTIEIDATSEPVGGMRFPIVDGALDFAAEGLTEFPGVFKIEGIGTAPFYPEKFVIRGPLDGFTVTSEGYSVEYDGPVGVGDELILTPYAGGRATLNGSDVSHNLIRADWVAVQPGETRGYLFTPIDPQPGSKLTVTHPLESWW